MVDPCVAPQLSEAQLIDPQEYLTDVLKRIASGRTKINQLHEPLPWRWKAARQVTIVKGASRSPHRRVLADAWGARRDPTDQPARQLRIRDAPRAPDQDRCTCHRAHRARPRANADELPGGSIVQSHRARLLLSGP
jgi:hypothetical protein